MVEAVVFKETVVEALRLEYSWLQHRLLVWWLLAVVEQAVVLEERALPMVVQQVRLEWAERAPPTALPAVLVVMEEEEAAVVLPKEELVAVPVLGVPLEIHLAGLLCMVPE
jgi:hypothetical protein